MRFSFHPTLHIFLTLNFLLVLTFTEHKRLLLSFCPSSCVDCAVRDPTADSLQHNVGNNCWWVAGEKQLLEIAQLRQSGYTFLVPLSPRLKDTKTMSGQGSGRVSTKGLHAFVFNFSAMRGGGWTDFFFHDSRMLMCWCTTTLKKTRVASRVKWMCEYKIDPVSWKFSMGLSAVCWLYIHLAGCQASVLWVLAIAQSVL